jgi:hypothetical protein
MWTMLEPPYWMNKWLNNQNKFCKSWEVIKFYSCQPFDLKLSCQRKLHQKLKKLKFEFFKRP